MSTITEALAEIKTIEKRLQAKRDFVKTYMLRVDSLKDPLEKDGGSEKAVAEAQQAINDLQERICELRQGIQKANEDNTIKIEKSERTIADWLVWRREVAPGQQMFLKNLKNGLTSARQQVRQQESWNRPKATEPEKMLDIVVNIDESKLNAEIETLEKILGDLDGQLSLKNATVMI